MQSENRTAKALAKSADKYRLITENITDVVTMFDRSGKILFTTPSHERVLGRGNEVIGRSAFEFIHPEDVADTRQLIENACESREVVRREMRYLTPTRGYIWLESAGRFFDMRGEPACVVVSRDISERKSMDETLRKMQERLTQAHKMEAIGTLAGGIAHDFNNILSAILGFADLAKMNLTDRDTTEKRLDEILQAGIRARELVAQILTFSRQTETMRHPMEMAPLIKEALKFLRASLPATIEIRHAFPAADTTVLANPTQLHQVIMNLCTNAAYAMKDAGGILDVKLTHTGKRHAADAQRHGLMRGPYLKLEVSDSGKGIPKEIINKIFDPFFTTKARGEGTGMGLSVVHGIVKDMHGALHVTSEPGKGSVFQVFLPKYEKRVKAVGPPDRVRKTGTEKILLVDDEIQIVQATQRILESLGYDVVSTCKPRHAIHLFERTPGAFDLLITDMAMPNMTGKDLAVILRSLKPDLPIILCSGNDSGSCIKDMQGTGISSFVRKPLTAIELTHAVYTALHGDPGGYE